ncbi:hypothetical protein ACFQ0O_37135 [Saccharopolyspora spinosporotrichia]
MRSAYRNGIHRPPSASRLLGLLHGAFGHAGFLVRVAVERVDQVGQFTEGPQEAFQAGGSASAGSMAASTQSPSSQTTVTSVPMSSVASTRSGVTSGRAAATSVTKA